jgi:hypothetical protein
VEELSPPGPAPHPNRHPPLCYLYGRLLLSLLSYARCPARRATLWAQERRALSVLKLVRHLLAVADQGRPRRFQSPVARRRFLHQVGTTAQRLVAKASRKRRTSAQILRERLNPQTDFFEFTAALAA